MSTYVIMGKDFPLVEEPDLYLAKEKLQGMPKAISLWEVSCGEDESQMEPICISKKTTALKVVGLRPGDNARVWSSPYGKKEGGHTTLTNDDGEAEVLVGKNITIRVRKPYYCPVEFENMVIEPDTKLLVQMKRDY